MLICFEYFRAHLKWGPKIFSGLTIVATVVNQIEHKNCTVVKGFLTSSLDNMNIFRKRLDAPNLTKFISISTIFKNFLVSEGLRRSQALFLHSIVKFLREMDFLPNQRACCKDFFPRRCPGEMPWTPLAGFASHCTSVALQLSMFPLPMGLRTRPVLGSPLKHYFQ